MKLKNLLLFGLIFLFIASCSKKGEEIRNIGCITALTGSDANYGRSTQQGLDLALKEVNDQLGKEGLSYRYKIYYEDDQMSPKEGPSAFQKLYNVDKVPVIMGPFGSRVFLSVAPIAEKNKAVLLTASATSDDIANAGDYCFRTVPSNKQQGKDCAAFVLNKLNLKRVYILYVNDTYGVTLQESFKEYLIENGGQVVGEDAYDKDATNFRTQLTRIRNIKPDVVFFPGYYKEPALILKQAKDFGLQKMGIKFIGTDGSCTDDLIRIAGDAAENTYYSNLAVDFRSDDPEMKKFINEIKEIYNTEPDAYTTYYYDAFKMLTNAIKNIDWDYNNQTKTANEIKQALYNMEPYSGLTGITKFDSNGEVDKSFAIMVVQNGEFLNFNK